MYPEEVWCEQCGTFIGYVLSSTPRPGLYCGPCGQKITDEIDAERERSMCIACGEKPAQGAGAKNSNHCAECGAQQ